ncbi:hypothetical protein PTTG_27016 [Puccinia triticina 1-1 BBBD Race 1]|uniref:Uncharacterized protein n=1 Tax=Puccinia triticina (isolate 1-1 / race 1 (BBBD)) TaxID=630390 RepID=A0A180GP65_PUCT1|nr:hypothetical protein PTTG_27016 [Puccinia triticina 1-1 BBBD Race 1]
MTQAASDNMSLPSFDVSRDFAVPTGTMPHNQLPGPPTLLDPILPAEGSIFDPPAPAASFDSKLLASFANLTIDPPTHIDCSLFYHISLVYNPPVIMLVTLKTALFYVMEMTSLHTLSCMLKLDHKIIKLVASGGLQANSSAQALSYADKVALKTLPTDTQTVIAQLAIDPDLIFFNLNDWLGRLFSWEGIEDALEETAFKF